MASKTAKSYIYDGYKLDEYSINENPTQYEYNMRHANNNKIKIIADETDNKIYIYLNGKLNKTINSK